MIEKILPNRYRTHNCIENCIANLCDAANVDFRPMFLYSWNFGFDKSKDTIDEKLHYCSHFDIRVDRYFELSASFLNIKFCMFSKEYSKIVNQLIGNNVLLIKTDSYFVPWNLAYQKYHLPHFYLLIYNNEKKCFTAIDSFCNKDMVDLDDVDVNKIEEIFRIDLNYDRLLNKNTEMPREKFLFFLNHNRNKEIYNLIGELGRIFATVDSIEKLTTNLSDISNSVLIRRMSYITHSRINTKSLFEYLNLSKVDIESMNTISEKWESLKNLFIKILISKRLNLLQQVSDELMLLSNIENELCNKIIKT